jgi:hypothetical protein
MSVPTRHRSLSSDQADLFQRLEQPARVSPEADMDLGPELLGAINTALREARARGLSRERVVDEMNRVLPNSTKRITVRQLNAWTAQSKEFHEFPARYLPAFCVATDCDLPQRVLAQAIGADLVDVRESAALRLGQSLIESARLKREQNTLKRTLGG